MLHGVKLSAVVSGLALAVLAEARAKEKGPDDVPVQSRIDPVELREAIEEVKAQKAKAFANGRAKVARWRAAIVKQEAATEAKVRRSKAYKTAVADESAKQKRLEDARAGGNAQERLSASRAYLKARAAREAMLDDALAKNKELQDARLRFADAREALIRTQKLAVELDKKLRELEEVAEELERPKGIWENGQFAMGQEGVFGFSVTVVQIIDDENMIVSRRGQTVWAKGFATNELADGSETRLPGRLRIARTTKYTAVSGAVTTLFVIEPVH